MTRETMTCLQLVKPAGQPFRAPLYGSVRRCSFGNLYFFAVMRPSAQLRASAHFYSDIFRLKFAKDLGKGMGRFPYLLNHSTPWASGSSAAIFAHSSAFSFPVTPWCAGCHWISMMDARPDLS
jgi:hypothetical protein